MRSLAFDQSYTCTGVAEAEDGVLMYAEAFNLTKLKSKTEKRNFIRTLAQSRAPNVDIVIVERVRLFSKKFISKASVTSLATVMSSIIDGVDDVTGGLQVFSVDTQEWKKVVLGNRNASKEDAVKFVSRLIGPLESHDAADAACMALYPFSPNPKLEVEK